MKFEHYDYGQYDSFLVSADTPKECKEIVAKEHSPKEYGEVDWQGGFKIQYIGATNRKKQILLSSYNAG